MVTCYSDLQISNRHYYQNQRYSRLVVMGRGGEARGAGGEAVRQGEAGSGGRSGCGRNGQIYAAERLRDKRDSVLGQKFKF